MSKKLDIETIKGLKKDSEFNTLIANYKELDNEYNNIKDENEPKLLELLLSTNPHFVDEENKDMEINLEQSYLLNDESLEEFYKLSDEYWKDKGYKLESGVSPILIAKNEMNDALTEVLKYVADAIDISYDKMLLHFDIREKFINIIKRAFIN